MALQELEVLVGVVALALVSGVALHHRAAHVVDDGLPELGVEIVLVALLAGVDLGGHLAGEGHPQGVVELEHVLRGDDRAK